MTKLQIIDEVKVNCFITIQRNDKTGGCMTHKAWLKVVFAVLFGLVFFMAMTAKADTYSIIKSAAKTYNVPVRAMLAIAVIESNYNVSVHKRFNKNGTYDVGLFQINSVNAKFCRVYNIYTLEGNTFCAAKIMRRIMDLWYNDPYKWGRYHSNTKRLKRQYAHKVQRITDLFESH